MSLGEEVELRMGASALDTLLARNLLLHSCAATPKMLRGVEADEAGMTWLDYSVLSGLTLDRLILAAL